MRVKNLLKDDSEKPMKQLFAVRGFDVCLAR